MKMNLLILLCMAALPVMSVRAADNAVHPAAEHGSAEEIAPATPPAVQTVQARARQDPGKQADDDLAICVTDERSMDGIRPQDMKWQNCRSSVDGMEDGAAPVKDPVQTDWSAPQDGVQIRVRTDRKSWRADEIPALRWDARNTGNRQFLQVAEGQRLAQLEVDGAWHQWPAGLRITGMPVLGIGRSLENQLLTLSPIWSRAGAEDLPQRGNPGSVVTSPDEAPSWLQLKPGTHTIRVAILIGPPKAGAGEGIRVVSPPLDIMIEAPPVGQTSAWLQDAKLVQAVEEAVFEMIPALVDPPRPEQPEMKRRIAKALAKVKQAATLAENTPLRQSVNQLAEALVALQQAVGEGRGLNVNNEFSDGWTAYMNMVRVFAGEIAPAAQPGTSSAKQVTHALHFETSPEGHDPEFPVFPALELDAWVRDYEKNADADMPSRRLKEEYEASLLENKRSGKTPKWCSQNWMKAPDYYKKLNTRKLAQECFEQGVIAIELTIHNDPSVGLTTLRILHDGVAELLARTDMFEGILQVFDDASARIADPKSDLAMIVHNAGSIEALCTLCRLSPLREQIKGKEPQFLKVQLLVLKRFKGNLDAYDAKRMGRSIGFFGEPCSVANMSLVFLKQTDLKKYEAIVPRIKSVRFPRKQRVEDLLAYLDMIIADLDTATPPATQPGQAEAFGPQNRPATQPATQRAVDRREFVGIWQERANPRKLTLAADGGFTVVATADNDRLLNAGTWEVAGSILKRKITRAANPAHVGQELTHQIHALTADHLDLRTIPKSPDLSIGVTEYARVKPAEPLKEHDKKAVEPN